MSSKPVRKTEPLRDIVAATRCERFPVMTSNGCVVDMTVICVGNAPSSRERKIQRYYISSEFMMLVEL